MSRMPLWKGRNVVKELPWACLAGVVLTVGLTGCGGSDPTPPAAQGGAKAKGKEPVEGLVLDWPPVGVESTAEGESTGESGNEGPPPTVAVNLPPDEGAPVPFEGQDADAGDPIPAEIRRRRNEDDSVALNVELLRYPHPEVRRSAAYRLRDAEGDEQPQAVLALRGALKDPDGGVRADAVKSLQELGLASKSAIPTLIRTLYDSKTGIASDAARALETFGPDAASAVPHLIAALPRLNWVERESVLQTLTAVGPAARPAIPHLPPLLDKTPESARSVGEALGKMGAEPEVLALLKAENPSKMYAGVIGAGHLPNPSRETISLLTRRTAVDVDFYFLDYVAAEAVVSLARIKPATQATLTEFARCAKSENDKIRLAAMKALGMIEPQLPDALPLLLAGAKDEDEDVREAAAAALGNYQGNAGMAGAESRPGAQDGAERRLEAIFNVVVQGGHFRFGEPIEGIVNGRKDFLPILRRNAADPQRGDQDRALALYALLALADQEFDEAEDLFDANQKLAEAVVQEPNAGPALRAVAALQLEEHPQRTAFLVAGLSEGKIVELRRLCAKILGNLAAVEAVPALAQAVNDPNVDLAHEAIESLQNFDESAAAAVPALVEHIQRKGPRYEQAAQTLGRLQARPDLCTPVLFAMAKDRADRYHASAMPPLASILRKHRQDLTPLMALLEPALDGKLFPDSLNEADFQGVYLESHQRDRASRMHSVLLACAALGPDAAPLTMKIAQQLPETNDFRSPAACAALGAIGPAAKEAAPKLVHAAATWKSPGPAIKALIEIQSAPGFIEIAPRLLENIVAREVVLNLIVVLGAESSPLVPVLAKLVESSPDDELRILVADALGRLGAVSQPAVPSLLTVAKTTTDEDLRDSVVQALLQIAPNDPEVLKLDP